MHSRFRRATTVVAAGMLTAMLATATTASADTTTKVTQTVTSGTLEGFIVGSSLSSLDYSHSWQTSSGSMDLRVDDSSGSDAGWHVTVQSSDFVHGGAGSPIPASNFYLQYASDPMLSYEFDPFNPFIDEPGQAIGTPGGPDAVTRYGSLDQARIVSSADAGYGKGRYQQDLMVRLDVPGQSLAGSYTGTVTTTAISGPADSVV